jgi:hypothetical protein
MPDDFQPPLLGYFSPLETARGQIDTLPPEVAVGGTATHSEQNPF